MTTPKSQRNLMEIEGVVYDVNWRKFKKGTAVFFPCLDVDRATTQLMVVLNRLRIKVLVKPVVEDGIRGLRVWRM
jgi:hypothetical protein